MMILLDGIVAFLCCVGIIATFFAVFFPKRGKNTYITGVIVSEDPLDTVCNAKMLKSLFNQVIVVTTLDLEGIVDENIKVISPEEFEKYVTRADQN